MFIRRLVENYMQTPRWRTPNKLRVREGALDKRSVQVINGKYLNAFVPDRSTLLKQRYECSTGGRIVSR